MNWKIRQQADGTWAAMWGTQYRRRIFSFPRVFKPHGTYALDKLTPSGWHTVAEDVTAETCTRLVLEDLNSAQKRSEPEILKEERVVA